MLSHVSSRTRSQTSEGTGTTLAPATTVTGLPVVSIYRQMCQYSDFYYMTLNSAQTIMYVSTKVSNLFVQLSSIGREIIIHDQIKEMELLDILKWVHNALSFFFGKKGKRLYF